MKTEEEEIVKELHSLGYQLIPNMIYTSEITFKKCYSNKIMMMLFFFWDEKQNLML